MAHKLVMLWAEDKDPAGPERINQALLRYKPKKVALPLSRERRDELNGHVGKLPAHRNALKSGLENSYLELQGNSRALVNEAIDSIGYAAEKTFKYANGQKGQLCLVDRRASEPLKRAWLSEKSNVTRKIISDAVMFAYTYPGVDSVDYMDVWCDYVGHMDARIYEQGNGDMRTESVVYMLRKGGLEPASVMQERNDYMAKLIVEGKPDMFVGSRGSIYGEGDGWENLYETLQSKAPDFKIERIPLCRIYRA